MGPSLVLRRTLVPLLLALALAALLAWWLDVFDPGGTDPAEEVGRASEESEDAPPMLKGAADAATHGKAQEDAPKEASKAGVPPPTVARAAPVPAEMGKGWRLVGTSRDPASGDVSVRVVDAQGRPRAGLEVRLHAMVDGRFEDTHKASLDADGRARLEGAPPGSAYVWIHPGKGSHGVRVLVVAGRETVVEAVIPGGAVVAGVVRHTEQGVLSGIEVALVVERAGVSSYLRDTTDAEGRYRLEGVPEGSHGVSLRGMAIGYHPRDRARLVVRGEDPIERDFVLGRISLQGRVRDAATDVPLPEVRVTADPGYAVATTDASGTYRFIDLPPVSTRVSFSKDGYRGEAGPEIELVDGVVATVHMDLRPASTLILCLRTPQGGAVTGSFQLTYVVQKGSTGAGGVTGRTTDGRGVARYARILPGAYRLEAKMDGYDIDPIEAVIGARETTVEFVCRPRASELPPALRGIVRDAHTRNPIAGARIRPQNSPADPVVTNARGEYVYRAVRGSGLRLIVSADGYGIRFLSGVALTTGQETVLDIELSPAAVLHLWITDASGAPVVGDMTLVIHPKKGTEGTSVGTGVRADADGHAVYRQVLPGDYKLAAISEKAGRGEVEAVITAGENTVRMELRVR